jgi:hypothetical protein
MLLKSWVARAACGFDSPGTRSLRNRRPGLSPKFQIGISQRRPTNPGSSPPVLPSTTGARAASCCYTYCDVLDALLSGFERLQSPVLTRNRVRLAYAIAGATDVLQMFLGPFGWAFVDEVLDLMAMILTWRLIGFHPLLLPTFALEFLPIADMLPTWTGCVAIVVTLRQRQQQAVARTPPSSAPGSVIDV